MHNSKTCCLEQSDGQNFPLLYSQSNAEKRHMIIKKSDSPKCRTTGQYICWSHSLLNVSQTSCYRYYFVETKKKSLWYQQINIDEMNRATLSPQGIRERCSSWPFPCTYLLLSAAAVAKHLQYDHLNTVDCRFLGISLITWCSMAPNTTNSIPHVRKITRKSPKARYQVGKAVALSRESGAERSRSRSTFHFSKSSCPFIHYWQILFVLCRSSYLKR